MLCYPCYSKSQILRIKPTALLNCRFSFTHKKNNYTLFHFTFFFFSFEFNVGVFALKTTHCVRMCRKDNQLTWRTWARTLVKIYQAPPYAGSCKKKKKARLSWSRPRNTYYNLLSVNCVVEKKKKVVQSWQHKLFTTFFYFLNVIKGNELLSISKINFEVWTNKCS